MRGKETKKLLQEFERLVLENKIKESYLYKQAIDKKDGSIGSLFIKEHRILKSHGLI